MVVVTLNRVDNGDIHLDRPIIVFLALLDGDAGEWYIVTPV